MTQLLNPSLIRSRTAEARAAAAADPTENYDAQTLAVIAAFMAGDFGCQTESVRKLVSAIIGAQIPIGETSFKDFTIGTLIVSPERAEGTQLVTGIDGDKDAYVFPVNPGNGSYVTRRAGWRFATDDEITVFIAELGIPDNTTAAA